MAGEDEQAGPAAPGRRGGRLLATVVVAAIMVGEGVAIFFLVKAISPQPAPAVADDRAAAVDMDYTGADKTAEIELADCRPGNMMAGKFVTFHIRVSGLVSYEDVERAKELVRAKRARIHDGVNVVIRSAEPKHLKEPGLETIRRRLKHELARIFGDDELIKQVLIPQMLQSGPGV